MNKGQSIPAQMQQKHDAIWAILEPFCREHLNDEYRGMCERLLGVLARKRPSPLVNGTAAAWACGIVRTIGWVNFLGDSTTTPHMKMTAVDKVFGVSSGTGQAKSKAIRTMLKIRAFDPEWTLPSRMDDNPMTWMRYTMTVLLAGVVILTLGIWARAEWVWLEGEKPTTSDFVKHNWYDAVEKSALSGDNWLKRVVQVSALRTHAIVGFAGGSDYDLPGAKIHVKTVFVSLILTLLDDQPIEQSRHILVTALARDKQSGSEYSADGKRLERLGSPPLLLEPVQATLTLKGLPVKDVRPLDLYGVPKAGMSVEHKSNEITIDGRCKACW